MLKVVQFNNKMNKIIYPNDKNNKNLKMNIKKIIK